MHRIELVGSPVEPHWYIEASTARDAVLKLALRFRPHRKPEVFSATGDFHYAPE